MSWVYLTKVENIYETSYQDFVTISIRLLSLGVPKSFPLSNTKYSYYSTHSSMDSIVIRTISRSRE